MSSNGGETRALQFDSQAETTPAPTETGVPGPIPKPEAWRKIDLRLLWVDAMFYLLSFLDRTNLGNAKIVGLQKDLNMREFEYAMALIFTFVPYILVEIPSNLLMKRVGPHKLMPLLLTLWGIVTTLQGLVKTYHQLLVCRFFLGLFEGGVTPGMVLYLASFYPARMLSLRIACFFSMGALASTFSGVLAYNIIKLDGKGGKAGWAWIFILEGSFTFLFGCLSFFLLPKSPEHCSFLDNDEKAYVIEELKRSGQRGTEEDDKIRGVEIRKALTSRHVQMTSVIFFFAGSVAYGLAYFTPTIVHGLGYKAARAQLFTAPPFALGFLFCFACAFLSDRYQYRSVIVVFSGISSTIGFTIYLCSTSFKMRYVSLFFSIVGASSVQPAIAAWVATNSAPYPRRATAIAFNFAIANVGGILATLLFGKFSHAPLYITACATLLAFSLLMIAMTGLTTMYLFRKNKKKRKMMKIAETLGQSCDEGTVSRLGDSASSFFYNY